MRTDYYLLYLESIFKQMIVNVYEFIGRFPNAEIPYT